MLVPRLPDRDKSNGTFQCLLITFDYEKTFRDRGSGFVKEKKEYFMSLDWDLTWKILQVVALLIIAREIDKRIRKRKNK